MPLWLFIEISQIGHCYDQEVLEYFITQSESVVEAGVLCQYIKVYFMFHDISNTLEEKCVNFEWAQL